MLYFDRKKIYASEADIKEAKPVLRIHDILVWIRIRKTKTILKKFFCLLGTFWRFVHLHNFLKIKSQKEVTKQ